MVNRPVISVFFCTRRARSRPPRHKGYEFYGWTALVKGFLLIVEAVWQRNKECR